MKGQQTVEQGPKAKKRIRLKTESTLALLLRIRQFLPVRRLLKT